MAKKRSNPEYIEPADFKALIFARKRKFEEEFGGGMTAFARSLGVSRAAVYNLMDGSSEPSEELLNKLGARWVICVEGEPKK